MSEVSAIAESTVEPSLPLDVEVWDEKKMNRVTGLAHSTLWWKEKNEPDFPKYVKISANKGGWLSHEVMAWLHKKVRESRTNPRRGNPVKRRAAGSTD